MFHAFSLAFCISFPSRNNRCKILVNLARGQIRVILNSKINIVRESLKSVVMVTSAQRPCGLQSFLLLYYFLYNRNRTSLKIKLTLLGKNRQRICKKSKADLKDNKKKKGVLELKLSPSIFPVPVVELYNSVLSMMVRYMVWLSAPLQSQRHFI